MPTVTPEPLFQLLCRIRTDQAERWQRGETVRVEHYLSLYPDLAHQAEALLDLIGFELQHRLETGEQPSLEEYLARFPQLGDAVRRIWISSQRAVTPRQSNSDILATTAAGPTEDIRPSRRSASAPTLPGFEMQEMLGESGMGVVYKARDLRLNQLRAIKFIRAAIADDMAQERFGREAKAAARLDHPGVVRIYAMGDHEGELFICMEYLEGGNLHGRLRRGVPEVREAAELVRLLALAVQHAHDNKVLHRDLKPANVLLTAAGVPKIADFGLAKLLDEDDGLTRIGDVMGTPSYMAPEQAEGRSRDVAETADVWALGAILYECLTGRPPFKGEGRSETMEQVKKQAPVPPRRLRAEVPDQLEAICLKCLEKRPENRYAAAVELADHLQSWLDGKPIRIRNRRSRRPLVATVAFLLLAAVAAAPFLRPSRPPDKPAPVRVSPQPDAWIPLLEREPELLCCSILGQTGHLKHNAQRRELRAFSKELGLLALGETTASRYQIAITLGQSPWIGDIGLFFGYRADGSGANQTWSYQALILRTPSSEVRRPNAAPGEGMYMDWMSVRKVPGRGTYSHRLANSSYFSLKPGEHRLTLTIGPAGLESVTLGNEQLASLCAADAARLRVTPPKRAEYQGKFGVYLYTANGTFTDARYLFHKDPP